VEAPRREAYRLPRISSPSLEDLRVQVAAAQPPTGDQLVERLYQRVRAAAPRRERGSGEPVERGDEVECDIVTLVDGRVVRGGVKSRAVLEMREFVHLPGFLEQVLGMPAFSARTFDLKLPPDYPVAEAAGRTATIFVEARRVFAVPEVDMEDAGALRRAGLGDSLEEALESVAAEIDEEQGEALLVEATQTVLSALAQRVQAEVPAAAIDEELRQVWQGSEGALLRRKGFESGLLEQAESDFLSHPALRAEAEERIRIGLALGALVDREGLAPSRSTMRMLLETAAGALGTTVEEARQSVAAEPAYATQAGQSALYMEAVQFVMSKAIVDVVEPDQEAVAPAEPSGGAEPQ
jgi:trigger factor